MSNSKNPTGGVRVEHEIVSPALRVESRDMAALPSWVMLQVRAALDARGLNPLLVDEVFAQDALAFVRAFGLSDSTASEDVVQALARIALRDRSAAQDPMALLVTTGPIRDNGAAVDGGSIYLQNYAVDYVEPTYVGDAITTF